MKSISVGRNPVACLPFLLIALCQLRNFPCEFIEKSFAILDQSSCAIYVTWYRPLLFFWEFPSIIPFMGYDFQILVKSRGGGIFLSLASSVKVWQEYFFFQLKAKYLVFHFFDLDGTIFNLT